MIKRQAKHESQGLVVGGCVGASGESEASPGLNREHVDTIQRAGGGGGRKEGQAEGKGRLVLSLLW